MYFLRVVAGGEEDPAVTRSGLLRYRDWIEMEIVDVRKQPLPHATYNLLLSDGSVRQGQADGRGTLREEDVPPGPYRIVELKRPSS